MLKFCPLQLAAVTLCDLPATSQEGNDTCFMVSVHKIDPYLPYDAKKELIFPSYSRNRPGRAPSGLSWAMLSWLNPMA